MSVRVISPGTADCEASMDDADRASRCETEQWCSLEADVDGLVTAGNVQGPRQNATVNVRSRICHIGLLTSNPLGRAVQRASLTH